MSPAFESSPNDLKREREKKCLLNIYIFWGDCPRANEMPSRHVNSNDGLTIFFSTDWAPSERRGKARKGAEWRGMARKGAEWRGN